MAVNAALAALDNLIIEFTKRLVDSPNRDELLERMSREQLELHARLIADLIARAEAAEH